MIKSDLTVLSQQVGVTEGKTTRLERLYRMDRLYLVVLVVSGILTGNLGAKTAFEWLGEGTFWGSNAALYLPLVLVLGSFFGYFLRQSKKNLEQIDLLDNEIRAEIKAHRDRIDSYCDYLYKGENDEDEDRDGCSGSGDPAGSGSVRWGPPAEER